LALILDHHREIEARFADLKAATSAEAKRAAQKELALILTAHSLAEEVAVYPALAADKQLAHAELAYQEQSAAKMEMGLLERLVPSSEDYADKVEHIRAAVAHHVYSEEGTWFTELAENSVHLIRR
jgi:hemerythrin superfamily protein